MAELKAAYTIDHSQLQPWLKAICDSPLTLVAPTTNSAGLQVLAHLTAPDNIQLDYANTRNSIRELFVPRSEVMFEFVRNETGYQLAPLALPDQPTVVFGVRPCDAAAVAVTDRVFLAEPLDAAYQARRQATTLVTLFCDHPRATCLCGAVGGVGQMARQVSDLVLTPLAGGQFVVEVLTDKGQTLADLAPDDLSPATQEQLAAAAAVQQTMEDRTRRNGRLEALPGTILELWDHPAWAEHAARCIGCGTCTYLCPACQCFDILDEAPGDRGIRYRCWDTCQFRYFTLHASMHNPRPDQASRLRQRILHKFKYQPETLGILGCTGCGRCVLLCPMGIAHLDVLADIAARSPSEVK